MSTDAFLVRVADGDDEITPEQAKRAFLVRLVNPPEPSPPPPPPSPPPVPRTEAPPVGSRPFRICTSSSVPAHSTVLFDNKPAYSPNCMNFPVVVPPDHEYWVTDLQFQSKMVRRTPEEWRSAYCIFSSIMTLVEHMPFVSYRVPIILPAGFTITGGWMNHSHEEQNMLAAMHGYVVPLK